MPQGLERTFRQITLVLQLQLRFRESIYVFAVISSLMAIIWDTSKNMDDKSSNFYSESGRFSSSIKADTEKTLEEAVSLQMLYIYQCLYA